MTSDQRAALFKELLALPEGQETEWVEFKHNFGDPDRIGEYLSALANAAALHRKSAGYLCWGVEDGTRRVVGTTFRPKRAKKGGQDLEGYLALNLSPRIDFVIHEFALEGHDVALLEVPAAAHTPIRFKGVEYIRCGSHKMQLREFPEKGRALWAIFAEKPFEKGLARTGATADEVLALLDYPGYFRLTGQSLPPNKAAILERLAAEKLVLKREVDRFDVSNLGAILFAHDLRACERLGRKSLRVIVYQGTGRVETVRERHEPAAFKGYAVGFEEMVAYIDNQLPQNEHLGAALRQEVRMYPAVAIRELVANALIHQDFHMSGTGPMVEIFTDRMEITNPGTPLMDPLRFIDAPPRSRNEELAGFMRRVNICEERGSGVDKVVTAIELFQLPAPDFTETLGHTRATLFAHRMLAEMDAKDRTRACYQHACLCYVSNKEMTNASLRKRFAIDDKNYPMASLIIANATKAGLIKRADPTSTSKKHASYVPFWG